MSKQTAVIGIFCSDSMSRRRGAAGQPDENVTKSKSFVAIRGAAGQRQQVNQVRKTVFNSASLLEREIIQKIRIPELKRWLITIQTTTKTVVHTAVKCVRHNQMTTVTSHIHTVTVHHNTTVTQYSHHTYWHKRTPYSQSHIIITNTITTPIYQLHDVIQSHAQHTVTPRPSSHIHPVHHHHRHTATHAKSPVHIISQSVTQTKQSLQHNSQRHEEVSHHIHMTSHTTTTYTHHSLTLSLFFSYTYTQQHTPSAHIYHTTNLHPAGVCKTILSNGVAFVEAQ